MCLYNFVTYNNYLFNDTFPKSFELRKFFPCLSDYRTPVLMHYVCLQVNNLGIYVIYMKYIIYIYIYNCTRPR